MWPAPFDSIFPYYLINCRISEKEILKVKCFSETFLILRRTERDTTKNVHRTSCKVPGILVRVLGNPNFLERLFEIHSNIKFRESPLSRSIRKVRKAHGHDEDNSNGRASGNFVNAPKNQPVNAAGRKNNSHYEIHTKHIYTMCRQNVEFLNVKGLW